MTVPWLHSDSVCCVSLYLLAFADRESEYMYLQKVEKCYIKCLTIPTYPIHIGIKCKAYLAWKDHIFWGGRKNCKTLLRTY